MYQHVVTGIHFTVKDKSTEQHQQSFPTHPDFNIHIHHHISLLFFLEPKNSHVSHLNMLQSRDELQKQGIPQASSNTLCTFALPAAKSIHPWSHFGIIYLLFPICFCFLFFWGGFICTFHNTLKGFASPLLFQIFFIISFLLKLK